MNRPMAAGSLGVGLSSEFRRSVNPVYPMSYKRLIHTVSPETKAKLMFILEEIKRLGRAARSLEIYNLVRPCLSPINRDAHRKVIIGVIAHQFIVGDEL